MISERLHANTMNTMIDINALPDLIEKGLVIAGVRVTGDSWSDVEVIITAPEPLLKEMGKNPALTALLEAIAFAAYAKPGNPQHRGLKSGLEVAFVCGLDGMARMQLSRISPQEPSDVEIRTIFEYWPVETCGRPVIQKTNDNWYVCKRFKANGHNYALVSWPIVGNATP